MARAAKPFQVIESEKRSHRTKAELQLRKEAENRLQSGSAMTARPEVRKNKKAYKEFKRIAKILIEIGKNDALFEAIINRYALVTAECADFEEKREKFYQNLSRLDEKHQNGEIEATDYFRLLSNMQSNIISLDRQIQAKRKMLLDIEKENIMTIASVLRSIPKKPVEEEQEDPMEMLLTKRA